MKAAFHFHAIRRSRVLWWINDRLGERERVLKKKKTSQNISLNLCVASAAQKKLPCGLRPSSKFASSSTSLASFHYFLIIWLSGLPIAWLVSGARHPDLFSSKWKITTTKKNSRYLSVTCDESHRRDLCYPDSFQVTWQLLTPYQNNQQGSTDGLRRFIWESWRFLSLAVRCCCYGVSFSRCCVCRAPDFNSTAPYHSKRIQGQ